MSVLHLACEIGNVEIFDLIMEYGPDLGVRDMVSIAFECFCYDSQLLLTNEYSTFYEFCIRINCVQ